MDDFATRLRELRIEHNMTLEELARATRISKASLGFWENCKNSPSLNAAITLAKFFNVSLGFLAGLED